MPSHQHRIVTFALDPSVDRLISELSEQKDIYRSQVVEASVRLLAELSKSRKGKEVTNAS